MVKETAYRRRYIDWYELMKRPSGQAFAHEVRGCNSTTRYQHGSARFFKQGMDERQHRQAFTHTGSVDPDELAGRPQEARPAHSFSQPAGFFFAFTRAGAKQKRSCRRQRSRREAVRTQREWWRAHPLSGSDNVTSSPKSSTRS